MNKIILNYTVILVSFIFLTNSLYSENIGYGSAGGDFSKVGGAGGQFLKIGVGARATAMGNAFSAVANDLTSTFWNPAGIAKVNSMAADFSYNSWLSSYSHSFAGIALPLGEDFTAAVSVISFSSGDIAVTTIEKPEGTGAKYQIGDIMLGLTVGGNLTDQFSFGFSAKVVNNKISTLSSTGLVIDIGTLFDTQFMGIKIGFSIHNLGLKQSFEGSELNMVKKLWSSMNATPLDGNFNSYDYSLPIIFRAGLSSEVYKDEEHSVLVAGEFDTYFDVKEQFSLGAEYVWNDLLALRGGYIFGQDQLGLTGGVGLKYDADAFSGRIDYSINPTKNLGLVNRISIGINLGQ